MVLSEIVTLVDLLRKLAQRKSELDKAYFDNFVDPIWYSFKQIHADYKASFLQYAKLASENELSRKQLIERVRQDSISTADLRAELNGLVRTLPNQGKADSTLHRFLLSLSYYFETPSLIRADQNNQTFHLEYGPQDEIATNFPRYHSIIALTRMSDDEVIRKAENFFNRSLVIIQDDYSIVAGNYYELRKDFLA